MLDNFSTGNRANLAGLDVEIVEGELRSYERVHNAVARRRGRLPPRRARLGAALGAGSAHLERRQRRGDAERPARGARRGDPPRRLLVELVGVRLAQPTSRSTEAMPSDPISPVRRREARRRALLRQLQPRLRVASRPSCCATSTSSGRGRARSRSTRPWCRSSSPRSPRGEPVTIFGDGEQSRDFTYVENVVDATLRASEAEGASGRIFNVAAGSPASVNAVADAIGRILGKPVERRHGPPRARRHPRLVGGRERGRARARLRPTHRPRGRAAPHDRVPGCLSAIKVLRVIARLNMGGPALHVAYLTAGLAERGYDTTLVAGSLARGEDSMAVRRRGARRRGGDDRRAAPGDLAAPRPAWRSFRLARLIRARAAADPAHAHGEGGRDRPARRAARGPDAAADRRPHLPRPRPARLLRPGPHARSSACSSAARSARTTALVAVSPEVRDDLVALHVAPAREVHRRPARDRAGRAGRDRRGDAGRGPAA